MKKKQITVISTPLFNEDDDGKCQCCPAQHVFSYKCNKPILTPLHKFMRERVNGDNYNPKKFRITIQEID